MEAGSLLGPFALGFALVAAALVQTRARASPLPLFSQRLCCFPRDPVLGDGAGGVAPARAMMVGFQLHTAVLATLLQALRKAIPITVLICRHQFLAGVGAAGFGRWY